MTGMYSRLRRGIKANDRFRQIIGTLAWRIHHTRAWMWRRMLWRTTVIAVIGSCGKTTTKELVNRCASEMGATAANLGSWSGLRFGGIAAAILSARLSDRYLVVEAGIEKPGEMYRVAELLLPDIVVVTRVAPAHLAHFGGLEQVAEEKGAIVEQCNRRGVVVLNRDDERVFAMKERTRARVITYGSHPEADFRCLSRSAQWPSRLTIQVENQGEGVEIRSKLVGKHWSESILAATATGHVLGLSLSRCAELIELQEPVWARMQPVELPSGITFIRDDYHGSPHNFQTAFEVMREAESTRKVLVTSGYSDSHRHARAVMRALAGDSYGIFGLFVFCGEAAKFAGNYLRDHGVPPEAVLTTNSISEVVQFLKGNLRRGDLVLLKGKTSAHMSRAYLGMLGDMQCELPQCKMQILCDRCPKLGFSWSEDLESYVAPPDCYL